MVTELMSIVREATRAMSLDGLTLRRAGTGA